MFEIRLIPSQNIKSIIPLVQLLNGIEKPLLLQRLEVMMQNNYQCVGVYDTSASLSTSKENLIGICGLWTLTKFYIGKHLEPDNVIILPEYRNKGVGELMMAWIDNYAKEQGCDAIELNAYIENTKGIEFWKKTGFYIRGHHFQKLIK
jgi:ribosomal protein S18 acetylase RimI-like enzyme